ncbi:MAG TPA: class II aldolase/adducin family protein [Spirochaetota bacterium]|nr:class II aldolase/adducin family protein [Spirochaetota bacterium]HNT11682.1 class II aldolase/adducin family protein [Spirochaetota bacterium]
MNDREQLVGLSKFAGERFDLVQAGGGNSSVKTPDGFMLIKASGVGLGEVEADSGFVTVDQQRLLRLFDDHTLHAAVDRRERESIAARGVADSVIGGGRPSIETLMHILFGACTLHVHPLVITAVVCRDDWDALIASRFPGGLRVPYRTPGIELALAVRDGMREFRERAGRLPDVAFLQNHGLIVSAGDSRAVCRLVDSVLGAFEDFLGVDHARFRDSNRLSELLCEIEGPRRVSYCSEHPALRSVGADRKLYLFRNPFFPDMQVYCGAGALELGNLDDTDPVRRYRDLHGELPRVVVYRDRVYFTAANVRKAREIEEVYASHVMALELAGPDHITSLPDEELSFLSGWEAEKYRRTLR